MRSGTPALCGSFQTVKKRGQKGEFTCIKLKCLGGSSGNGHDDAAFVDFWVLILKHLEEERKLFLYHVLMIETGIRRPVSRFFNNPCLITPFPTDNLL